MASSIYEFAQMPRVHKPTVGIDRPAREAGAAPRVGVIYNPQSHGNKGADFDCSITPMVHIAKHRSQLPDALARFAERGVDLLVINGGDGTVRDVLTCGAGVFGDDWPALAVLPKGKTNALAIELGLPEGWALKDAIDAFEKGERTYRRPMEIAPSDGAITHEHPDYSRVLGFILGAGAFTTATKAGQKAHRIGAFNAMAVAVAIVLGVFQWLFASRNNSWRRGARMKIGLGSENVPMSHSGVGDPEWRQILFASTLETMPAGARPFGAMRKGLKMVVTDQISRRSILMLVRMIRGASPKNMRERGFHQISTPQFTLEIEDSFILDGEAFPGGKYRITQGPELEFVTP